jgi:hypothetical protein
VLQVGIRRWAVILAAAAAFLLVAPDSPARAADAQARIDDVEQSLIHDPSYRVRVSAALVLGKLALRRSVPALLRALRDPHPAVRGTAARALGRIADPSTRAALQAATQDPSPLVKRMAHDALRALARGGRDPGGAGGDDDPPRPVRLAFEVKPMGDQSHHATAELRGHMRDYLSSRLRPVGDVSQDPASREQPSRAEAAATRGFIVDGVIKNLSMTTQPTTVEVTCAVQLVISRQPTGGVFLLSTGEAIVQKPRRQFRPQHRSDMEIEALENAVRGASEDLLHRLALQ